MNWRETMKQFLLFIFTLVFVIGLLNGCTDSAPTGPVVGLGNATVTKYVSIGNSLTAGYQSNGLYASAQMYSYPNLIAQQLRTAGAVLGAFEQPLYSDPGTPDPLTGKASRYEMISLVGPVIGPKGLAPGAPTNSTLARPYDNLGIPGIPLAGFMDTSGTYQSAPLGRDAILRWTTNAALGKSVFRQVATLKAMGKAPDLVTFWLGANDVLGFATSGGTSPNAPTPTATFQYLYNQALDTLRKTLPTAKIVVGNIPEVTAIPFFTTVNPLLAPSIPSVYYLRYQKHGTPGVSFDSTKLTEANTPLITLKGKAYAALLGKSTGQFWRDAAASKGTTIAVLYPTIRAAGIDTTMPFGFHPQNPWPDALILDAAEIASATNAIRDFNGVIASVAAAKGAALVDFNSFFNSIKANGLLAYGEEYTADYVTGDLFSLDGVHPSNRGYGIVANEYIKVINASFGMNVPLVDLNTLPKLSAPLAKRANGTIDPVLPFEAFSTFDWLFSPSGR
jgi:lysophospholipase L1-like esterase